MAENEKVENEKRDFMSGGFAIVVAIMMAILVGLMAFNQYQIASVGALIGSAPDGGDGGEFSLSGIDVMQIKSTAQGIAALFPLDSAKTGDDVIRIMIPTGVPEYGEAMGVSFDDPVNSMNLMAGSYPALKKQIQENEPGVWKRYLNLAAAPRGISCEFCCGVGPQGVDAQGNLRCGCEHSPAIQTVVLWLMQNTDYSDSEILREAYRWKTLWFPKNMVGIASQIAGGDTSVLQELPGMVGGC